MNEKDDWEELIDRHLRGELTESEKEHLAELLDSDAEARRQFVEQAQWDTEFAEVLRDSRGSIGELKLLSAERQATFSTWPLTVAAAAIVALVASVLLWPTAQPEPSSPPKIAKITGSSGSLLWTFAGGKVVRDLSVGTKLSGGTVEGVTPDSWVELEFNDQSTVMISGISMLTFSDDGHKELHLKEGSFSGRVNPQPAGKPMLVHTRTATLEVLGTQFNVDAGPFAATLSVSQGNVRVRRLSDGSTVDVPARHRVTAAADREMSLERVPVSVHQWKSQLQRGPRGVRGKWLPKTDKEDARLLTVPYITEQGKTIYTTGLGVSRGDASPVVLMPESRIRFGGRVRSDTDVYFGVTLRRENGDFAGRFQVTRPSHEIQVEGKFDIILELGDYQLDASLNHIKNKLPSNPFDLIVESVWCHTLFDQAGLEINEVELLPPVGDESNSVL